MTRHTPKDLQHTPHVSCRKSVSIDDHVTFKGDIEICNEGGQMICTLAGEFLRDGKGFDPPLMYSMEQVGVLSQYPEDILRPIYHYLLARRKLKSNFRK